MTSEELNAIEKRANAATKGPWWTYHPHPGGNCEHSLIKYDYDDVPTWLAESSSHPNSVANFEFMAASRTDVPDLCAAVRELQERVEAFTRKNERILAMLARM